MSDFNNINKMRFWSQKILPLVYDDSLSYYEVLCKVVNYLNKVIDDVNQIPDFIKEYVDEQLTDERIVSILYDFIRNVENSITENNEGENTTSSKDYQTGDLLWWKDELYRVDRDISVGSAFINTGSNPNISLIDFATLFNDFTDVVKDFFTTNKDQGDNASQNWNIGTLLWIDNKLYEVSKNIIEGNSFIYSGNNQNVSEVNIELLYSSIKNIFTTYDEGNNTTASRNYSVNDWIWNNNQLYNVTSNITIGEAFNGKVELVDLSVILKNILHITNIFVTPEQFGAVGDGVTDDTLAIQTAINTHKKVMFYTKTYYISDTIILPSNTQLDLGNCVIIGDVGSTNPIFKTEVDDIYGASRISIIGTDAIIRGTANSIFEFNGSDHFDASPSNYARDIKIDHIHGSSTDIYCFIKMNVAVRDMFITNCSTYTNNGIISNAKGVEIMIDNCLLYINEVGYPIKLESDLGTRWYNEGWSILNSTIDGPEGSEISIADVYTFEMANCYIGSHIKLNESTTTTHTRDIIINGNMISGNVYIGNDSADHTQAFYAHISSNIIMGLLRIDRGANIHINGNTFDTYPDTPSQYAITLRKNIEQCVVENNYIDNSFAGGIIAQNNVSLSCIHDNTYYGSGYGVTLQTDTAIVAVHDNFGGTSNTDIVQQVTGANIAVGSAIATIPVKLGKGQKGFIVGKIALTQAASSDATFAFSLPSGIHTPSGSGWFSTIIKLYNQQYLDICIPYWCDADITGNIVLNNYIGASVTIDSHSWISITR